MGAFEPAAEAPTPPGITAIPPPSAFEGTARDSVPPPFRCHRPRRSAAGRAYRGPRFVGAFFATLRAVERAGFDRVVALTFSVHA